jgi:hypothetical protein
MLTLSHFSGTPAFTYLGKEIKEDRTTERKKDKTNKNKKIIQVKEGKLSL